MQEQIEEYRKWLASEIVRVSRIAEPYAHHHYDAYALAFSLFNHMFPENEKDYDETCCPNCGETTCTEQCEFELERQRATIKADTIAK